MIVLYFILFFMTSSISWVIFTCLDYSKNNKMNEKKRGHIFVTEQSFRIHIVVSWVMVLCSLVDGDQFFGGPYCPDNGCSKFPKNVGIHFQTAVLYEFSLQ
jgi:hypothetical protein